MKKNIIKKLRQDLEKHNINQYDVIAKALGVNNNRKSYYLYYKKAIPTCCGLLLLFVSITTFNFSLSKDMAMTPDGQVDRDFFHSDIFSNIMFLIVLIMTIAVIIFIIRFIKFIVKMNNKKQ